MTNVRFEIDAKTLADLKSILAPKQVSKLVYAAVKRTTSQAVKIATKAVEERLTIPRRYISGKDHRRAAITSKMRGGDVPVGVITIRRKAIPLSAFRVRESKKSGVTVTIDKTKSPLTLRHAFVANVASKSQDADGIFHKGVFLRRKNTEFVTTRAAKFTPAGYAWRLPIKEQFGPSVLDFITVPEIESRVLRDIGNALQKNIDSQISRFTGGQFRSLAAALSANQLASMPEEPEPEDEFGGYLQ